MTAFIDSFTTQQLLPPWWSVGARFWGFIIEVPPACIQDYLDSHFNAPGPDQAPYRYDAIEDGNFGILTAAAHPDFSSRSEQRAMWDRLSHHQVHWGVPVRRHRVTADNLLVEPQVVWVQPFAFNDNSCVLFSGREIWGTEFEMAKIRFDEGLTPSDLHIDVAVQGFETFAPSSRGKLVPVMHARLKTGATQVQPAQIWSDAPEVRFLRVLVECGAPATPPTGSPGSAGTENFILPTALELNTLKQFRDVFDMRFAAYRAIVASQASYSNIRDVEVYLGSQVNLDFMWTDSLKEKFRQLFGVGKPADIAVGHPDDGAPGGPPGSGDGDADEGIDWQLPCIPIKVAFAFSFTAEELFEVTEVLHVYGQPGAV